MAVTFVSVAWTTTTPKTSPSFNVSAGDILVVVGTGEDNIATIGTPTNSGSALTWTLQQSNVLSIRGSTYVWTAIADSARALTVSATGVGGRWWGLDVVNVGPGSVGASAKTNSSSGAPSLAVATTGAASVLVAASSDCYGTSGTPTWRQINSSSPTPMSDSTGNGSRGLSYVYLDAGSAGSKTAGMSSPSGQAYSMVVVEVLPQASTPVSSSDSAAVGVSDTASVAVAVSVTSSDTEALGVASASQVATALGTTSGATLSVTESRTLSSASSRADSVSAGVTSAASLQIQAALVPGGTEVGLTVVTTASVKKAASRAALVNPWDLADQFLAVVRSPDWEEAVSARYRTIVGWGELVNRYGQNVPISADGVLMERLPISGYSVTMSEGVERWAGTVSFHSECMIPTSSRHLLWGASPVFLRLWWAVWSDKSGAWLPKAVCTLSVGDTEATDTGLLSGTLAGRDVLATLVAYGTGAPTVAGMTVSDAIKTIFLRSAPGLTVRVAPSTVIVPAGIVLRDPKQDLQDLVDTGYPMGVIRSDCLGSVYVGPDVVSSDTPLDWQEGPGCPVIDMKMKHGVTAMGNQLTAVSTHPDAVGLSVTLQDDDPTSPTYVAGAWGVHPLQPVESALATTLEALTYAGDASLQRGLHPTTDVAITIPQRPDLDGGRSVLLASGILGVAGVHTVSTWTLKLDALGGPSTMPVGMRQRIAQ